MDVISLTSRVDYFKCNKCENKCKKDTTLRKHKNTKHEQQLCSNGHIRFDNINNLQKHIAKDHSNSLKDRRKKTTTDNNIEHDYEGRHL